MISGKNQRIQIATKKEGKDRERERERKRISDKNAI